jgi:hypothetical protein
VSFTDAGPPFTDPPVSSARILRNFSCVAANGRPDETEGGDMRGDGRRAVWGIALMLLGGFLLFVQFGGIPDWLDGYAWWGGLVVAFGMITLLTAHRAESVGSGVTLMLLGLWVVLVTNHMFGFGWYNSWPLALVALGAGTVAHAIAANWLPDTRRERRERRRRRWEGENEETGHVQG